VAPKRCCIHQDDRAASVSLSILASPRIGRREQSAQRLSSIALSNCIFTANILTTSRNCDHGLRFGLTNASGGFIVSGMQQGDAIVRKVVMCREA